VGHAHILARSWDNVSVPCIWRATPAIPSRNGWPPCVPPESPSHRGVWQTDDPRALLVAFLVGVEGSAELLQRAVATGYAPAQAHLAAQRPEAPFELATKAAAQGDRLSAPVV
jgi:hypothetical protein